MRLGVIVSLGLLGSLVSRGWAAPGPSSSLRRAHVVEVAGEVAYLDVGRAHGLARGDALTYAETRLEIIEVAAQTTAVRAVAGLQVGVTVAITPGATRASVPGLDELGEPVAPPPASTWYGQWPRQRALPQPTVSRAVPLVPAPLGWRAELGGVLGGLRGMNVVERFGEARATLGVPLWRGRHAAVRVDGDATVGWFARQAVASRGIVHLATLGYDHDAVGRASQLRLGRLLAEGGLLVDGALARVTTPRVTAEVALGAQPEVLAGGVGTAPLAQVALRYEALDAPWQPSLESRAWLSTWAGQLDEQRLQLALGLARHGARLQGWAEAQRFAPGNPFAAPAVQLTEAGASLSYERRQLSAQALVHGWRPQRSLRLRAQLPAAWLCVEVPVVGEAPEACDAAAYWVTSMGRIRARHRQWEGELGGVVLFSRGVAQASSMLGHARVARWLVADRLRIMLGAEGRRQDFMEWVVGEAGLAWFAARWDASLRLASGRQSLAGELAPHAYTEASLESSVRWSPHWNLGLLLGGQAREPQHAGWGMVMATWRGGGL